MPDISIFAWPIGACFAIFTSGYVCAIVAMIATDWVVKRAQSCRKQ